MALTNTKLVIEIDLTHHRGPDAAADIVKNALTMLVVEGVKIWSLESDYPETGPTVGTALQEFYASVPFRGKFMDLVDEHVVQENK